MLEHAMDLGFAASQVGFKPLKAPAKKVKDLVVVRAKKVAAAKKSAQPPAKPALSKASKVVQAASEKPVSKAARAKPKAPDSKTKAPGNVTPTNEVAGKKVNAANPVGTKGRAAKGKAVSASLNTTQPTVPNSVEDKDYAHVLASLRKSKNKPTRKVRLYGAVRSLLKGKPDDEASVEQVVARLIREGHLEIDGKGAVKKAP
jgi:hypothetical protein